MKTNLMNASGYAQLLADKEQDMAQLCASKEDRNCCLGGNARPVSSKTAMDTQVILDQENSLMDRIRRANDLIAITDVAPAPDSNEVVAIGTIVSFTVTGSGKHRHLVGGRGEPNSIPEATTISAYSPLGRKLLDKEVGDTVRAEIDGRVREATIDAIELPPAHPVQGELPILSEAA